MKTRIEVREYVIAHGHSPRGRGQWAFRMRYANGLPVDFPRAGWKRPGWTDGIYWVNGTWTEAKAAALREARQIGAAIAAVGS